MNLFKINQFYNGQWDWTNHEKLMDKADFFITTYAIDTVYLTALKTLKLFTIHSIAHFGLPCTAKLKKVQKNFENSRKEADSEKFYFFYWQQK